MILKQIKQLINKHKLSADQLVILELLFAKDLQELEMYRDVLRKDHLLLVQNLYRRNYIDFYDNNNRNMSNFENIYVSSKGEHIIEEIEKLLHSMVNSEPVVINIEQQFEEFWDAYPGTDKWGTFGATRALRVDKEGTRKKFRKCLEEGYKSEDIISALKYQIELFKNTSKMAENKLTYFQNSSAYLNQRTFLSYLELMKENEDNSMEIKL